jgi:hypothetical protein
MFFINVCLLFGQTSVFNTVDIQPFLSLFSSSHSYNKLSVVLSLLPHGQVGVSSILNRCKYDLTFSCPVTMDMNLWVTFIFIFSLSATTGKYYFVISPFVVCSHSLCHFSTLISPSSLLTTSFVTFLWLSMTSAFVAASFAIVSANSFPWIPT